MAKTSYSFEDIFNMSPDQLDNHISTYTPDRCDGLPNKRYELIYYMYMTNLLNSHDASLLANVGNKLKEYVKIDNVKDFRKLLN